MLLFVLLHFTVVLSFEAAQRTFFKAELDFVSSGRVVLQVKIVLETFPAEFTFELRRLTAFVLQMAFQSAFTPVSSIAIFAEKIAT